MAKKKPNALDNLINDVESILIAAIPGLISQGVGAILHKHKNQIKDAAVPVKNSTIVQPLTEKTPAQKNCESQHAGQSGYCDSSGTWHPSN